MSNDSETVHDMPMQNSSARDTFFQVAELVSLVFIFTLPESWDDFCKVDQAPLLLTNVCHQWQAVAISTPQLWTQISVEFFVGTQDESLRARRRLEYWLQRSRACPVIIRYLDFTVEPSQDVPDLFKLLLPHSRRWQALELVLRLEDMIPLLKEIGSSDLSSLHSLDIEYHGEGDFSLGGGHIVIDLTYASRLSRFRYGGDDDDFSLKLPPSLVELEMCGARLSLFHEQTTFQHVHKLTLEDSLDAEDMPAFLSDITFKFPNLAHLDMHNSDDLYNEILIELDLLTLPKLRSLNLARTFAVLLDYLVTPNLEELSLADGCWYARWNSTFPAHMISFLQRSACADGLTSFSLYDDIITEEQLIDVLREMPQLEVLDVRNRNVSDSILAAVTLPPMDPGLASTLISLVCQESSIVEQTHPFLGLCPRASKITFDAQQPILGEDSISSVHAIVALILSRAGHVSADAEDTAALLSSIRISENANKVPPAWNDEGLDLVRSSWRAVSFDLSVRLPIDRAVVWIFKHPWIQRLPVRVNVKLYDWGI